MRLLVFIPSLSSGGAERVFSLLCNYWSEEFNWDITVVTFSKCEEDFYKLSEKIKRISIGLTSGAKAIPVAVVMNIRRILAIRKILKNKKPDVALGVMPTAACLLVMSSLGLKVSIVGAERTYPPCSYLGKIWEKIRDFAYPKLNLLVVQTAESALWASSKKGIDKVQVIPNPIVHPLPIHSPMVLPHYIVGQNTETNIILAVGRLEELKGFSRLINVFSALENRSRNWTLVILGEGPLRENLETQVKRLQLESQIFLPGAIGNLSDWYKSAKIFVLASEFEGFPNALLEAMSYGCAVVSVDCKTGPKEIIRDRFDGILVPLKDDQKLAEALDRLMSDKSLRSNLSRNAKEVINRYNIKKVANMWKTSIEKSL